MRYVAMRKKIKLVDINLTLKINNEKYIKKANGFIFGRLEVIKSRPEKV
jgi:hypothetical protein